MISASGVLAIELHLSGVQSNQSICNPMSQVPTHWAGDQPVLRGNALYRRAGRSISLADLLDPSLHL
jgi:hypothetical protein